MNNASLLSDIGPAALAYLGDSVIEICVRKALVETGISDSGKLNALALNFVRASAQSNAMKLIMDQLTPDELSFFKRGRNIGHTNVPKNATPGQYRTATGMEALFGYLYLSQKNDRIEELFNLAYRKEIESLENR